MTTPNKQVRRHHQALRASGLRPLQIWVPDTHRIGFAAECRRQAKRAAKAGRAEAGLTNVMKEALADIEDWSE